VGGAASAGTGATRGGEAEIATTEVGEAAERRPETGATGRWKAAKRPAEAATRPESEPGSGPGSGTVSPALIAALPTARQSAKAPARRRTGAIPQSHAALSRHGC